MGRDVGDLMSGNLTPNPFPSGKGDRIVAVGRRRRRLRILNRANSAVIGPSPSSSPLKGEGKMEGEMRATFPLSPLPLGEGDRRLRGPDFWGWTRGQRIFRWRYR